MTLKAVGPAARPRLVSHGARPPLALERGPSVSVLQNREVILSGVRFLGATLWTDFDLDSEPSRQELLDGARLLMNDYRLIRDGRAGLTPERTRALCLESQRFLRESLARPFPGPTVVVTHHAPSRRSWPEFAEDRHLRAACASDLEALMGRDHVALWIHGHTHWCVDYEIRGTRVVSNQRGYPGQEPPGFDPGRLFVLSAGTGRARATFP